MPTNRFARLILVAALAGTSALTPSAPAFALSELASGQTVGHQGPQPTNGNGTAHELPSVDASGHAKSGKEIQQSQASSPTEQKPATEAPAEPENKAEIIHDLSKLPEPVKKLRQAIVEAAASGDVERMRPIMAPAAGAGGEQGENDDPIETLKSFSGDPEGLEILAIMLDLLQTGAARIEAGTPDEVYVWPYFVGKPLSTLTAPEKVDLLRIITAGDLTAMEEIGSYNFYRIGISPDGKWKFIVSGD